MSRHSRVLLVTGLSGAGKASILHTLEDLGYEAIDNPPLTLVEELVSRSERPLAIGMDARSRGFDAAAVLELVSGLRAAGSLAELVYAWADDTVLLRRFTETRRRHPLAPQGRVIDGIVAETVLTQPLRDNADLVVDTSELPLPALRHMINIRFGTATEGSAVSGMTVSLVSFAFPAGLPRDADMVLDVRFLRNPHYDPILRSGTGLDPQVVAYVVADPDYSPFLERVVSLLGLVLPRFVLEGKKYATVAIGCTGGRHRSVCIVEQLAVHLSSATFTSDRPAWQVTVMHRELAREGLVARSSLALPFEQDIQA